MISINAETPALMVKFDRQAVENIVSVGEAVKITVTGQLTDGKKFEGSDTIKVISPQPHQ